MDPKAALPQHKRRETENSELQPRKLAQRLRCEREKQPILIPTPPQLAVYERECIITKNQFYQHPSLLEPGPSRQCNLFSLSQGSRPTNSNSSNEEFPPPNNVEQINDSHTTVLRSPSSHQDSG